jgi:hypothetical protein
LSDAKIFEAKRQFSCSVKKMNEANISCVVSLQEVTDNV